MGRSLILCTLLLLPLYGLAHYGVWEQRAEVRQGSTASYVLPSKFSRILALGHQGLLADFQLLKTMTFYGERSLRKVKLTDAEWQYFIAGLEATTDLDPYFVDPYVLAEGLLVWDAGKVAEANRLLEKGLKYRQNDWRLFFYAGFNYFYFLGDYTKAADYLMKASRMPGSPFYLQNLAARLAYYGGKSKTALLFLKEMLAETRDPKLAKTLEKRLLALERASFIEELIGKFIQEQGRAPQALQELVSAGYTAQLPEDPYDGEWGVLENGRVFSTSRFADPPKN